MYYSNWFVVSYILFSACFTKCSAKCAHQIRVTLKRNLSTLLKKSDIVTKSELVSVNATLGAQHKQYHALLIYCCDFGTQRAFWPRWAREGGLGRHAGGALFLWLPQSQSLSAGHIRDLGVVILKVWCAQNTSIFRHKNLWCSEWRAIC